MRNAFANEITRLALADPRVVLLAGDIGNKLFDEFKSHCPDRFYNCGVAEANMIGVAAGLALNGLRPVIYTINAFLTARCYEQIRIDLCYHNVPAVLVGVGSGLGYAQLGATHHSCEDLGMMRILPNMTVIAPADAAEVKAAVGAALQQPSPVFIRIGKRGEPAVHKNLSNFKIGKAIEVISGSKVCLLATGSVVTLAMETARILEETGISTQVISFHTIKPLDTEQLAKSFSNFSLVATIEEHSVLGGFGGSVTEWLCDQPKQKALYCRIGTKDHFLHEAGEQEHARALHGLTPDVLAQTFRRRLSEPQL